MRIKLMFARLKDGFADFRRGLSIIFGKPEKGKGNRKLARISKIIMGQISTYGNKKDGKAAIEELIQNALSTPEYMQLLHKLNLDEPHIRVIAMEVLKKYEK